MATECPPSPFALLPRTGILVPTLHSQCEAAGTSDGGEEFLLKEHFLN